VLREAATVVAKQGNVYTLQCQRQNSCGSCASKAGCGTSALTQYMGNKPIIFEIEDNTDYQPGEMVELGLPEQTLLKGGFLIYLLPLIVFIVGMAAIEQIFDSARGYNYLAFVLMAISFYWVRHISKTSLNQDKYKPVIIGRMGIEDTSINFVKNQKSK
jgi:sigma-E factor negative regulatory protein RseC